MYMNIHVAICANKKIRHFQEYKEFKLRFCVTIIHAKIDFATKLLLSENVLI